MPSNDGIKFRRESKWVSSPEEMRNLEERLAQGRTVPGPEMLSVFMDRLSDDRGREDFLAYLQDLQEDAGVAFTLDHLTEWTKDRAKNQEDRDLAAGVIRDLLKFAIAAGFSAGWSMGEAYGHRPRATEKGGGEEPLTEAGNVIQFPKGGGGQ